MPLYYFECRHHDCGAVVRKIMTPDEAVGHRPPCPNCDPSLGSRMVRMVRPPSSQAVETLDNGAMTKRLERPVDAERLYAERNEAIKKGQS